MGDVPDPSGGGGCRRASHRATGDCRHRKWRRMDVPTIFVSGRQAGQRGECRSKLEGAATDIPCLASIAIPPVPKPRLWAGLIYWLRHTPPVGRIRAHYVPQFYLRNFGRKINFYDKQEQKIRRSSPVNIGCERDYFAIGSDAVRIEHALRNVENDASQVMSRMIKTESLKWLSGMDAFRLCRFVALQHIRSPEYKRQRHDFAQSVLDAMPKNLGTVRWRRAEKEEYEVLSRLDPAVPHTSPIPHIMQKGAILSKNKAGRPLWTSDSPVVRHNGLTGRTGFGDFGVRIHLPLTPELLLSFYDREAYGALPDTELMDEAGVMHANRLQAKLSTRFVYSSTPEFHMIEKMTGADGGHDENLLSCLP